MEKERGREEIEKVNLEKYEVGKKIQETRAAVCQIEKPGGLGKEDRIRKGKGGFSAQRDCLILNGSVGWENGHVRQVQYLHLPSGRKMDFTERFFQNMI